MLPGPARDRRWYAAQAICDTINISPGAYTPLSPAWCTELFAHVGPDTYIRPPLYVDFGSNISIGARCYINLGLTALDYDRISIGDDVKIATHVQLVTPYHHLEPLRRLQPGGLSAPICVQNNVWLGSGVIVCPGVTIGAGTVVGAGSVVTRDLPPMVLAVGSPARVIRTVEESDVGSA